MKSLILVFTLFFTLSTYSLEGWEKIHTESNISIYSKPAESGILPFRAIGTISAPIQDVLNALMDLKNKNIWSPKLKDVKVHKKISEYEMTISEYYKTPWPATDREFLLQGKLDRVNSKKFILKAHSINNSNLSSRDHIQADVKFLDITIEDNGNNTTFIDFRFRGDFKGWMPIWLTNLIQKKWPLRFIQGLEKYINQSDEIKLSSN
ncbi:START domain-containing protein [Halobacteriovorax sp. JY17]|uniref:START domain-containing protein n=1 Tax=Halobacteriovorax sp. JY17 TaxID=2014617 RepID=UPI000C6BF9F6|nr:START domain-containing protein [Halobacteriovorax sp. JY17]PIK14021.1 MAG: hypothetical protein CES88_13640 [Halobacteriovorax sp. JY17]